jgi:hypothetical protein
MWQQEELKTIARLLTVVLLGLSSARAREHVAVLLVNNAVLVPVHVNNRDLSFLLDTGGENSACEPHRC